MPFNSKTTDVTACRSRRLLAVLCLLLVFLASAAQLLHAHTAGPAAEHDCSLCAVAHLTATPAPVVAEPPRVELVWRAPAAALAVAASRPHPLALTIRPPPALTAAA